MKGEVMQSKQEALYQQSLENALIGLRDVARKSCEFLRIEQTTNIRARSIYQQLKKEIKNSEKLIPPVGLDTTIGS